MEAGFSPTEALQTATLNPAKFLGKTDTFGTIQAGRVADLVLLNANPLLKTLATRGKSENAVVLGGKFYPLANIRAQSLSSW